MGHKINPFSNRLPITKRWQSRWFSDREYSVRLLEDIRIRKFVIARYAGQAAIGQVEIKRMAGGQIQVIIQTSKPGIVIGRAGAGINELRKSLEDLLGISAVKKVSKGKNKGRAGNEEGSRLKIDVVEIKVPELWSILVAETIAGQIERRIMYRRAMKQAIDRVMSAGAKGVKIVLSGRLGGAEIARTEKQTEGSVPLSSFNINIDYAQIFARTTYGTIGIKVWVNRNESTKEVEIEEQG